MLPGEEKTHFCLSWEGLWTQARLCPPLTQTAFCSPHPGSWVREGSGPESLKEAFLEGGKQDMGGPNICLGFYLPCTQRSSYHSSLKLEKLLFYILGQLREVLLWIVNRWMQILDNYYVPDCARYRVTTVKKDKFGKRWGICPGS